MSDEANAMKGVVIRTVGVNGKTETIKRYGSSHLSRVTYDKVMRAVK